MNRMDDHAMIRTHNLAKRFGDLWAVKGLNLSIPRGEIFGMVGPDGAGKTTIMRMLSGILEPSEGNAWVAGFDLSRDPEMVKERIGYMSQRFGLYEDLTVIENLLFYADLFDVPKRKRPDRIKRLLGFSNLTPFTSRLTRNLSGGMKQKLGLACALIHTPEVLLLDEPTCGVDPISRRDFWKILYELLRESVTILVSTAYLDEAERCHRVGLLHQGRIIAEGSPDRIKEIIPGRTFELRLSEPKGVVERIEAFDGVIQANLFGNSVHVVLKQEEGLLLKLIKRLEDEGEELLETRPISPTLEDAFISIVKREEGRKPDGSSP